MLLDCRLTKTIAPSTYLKVYLWKKNAILHYNKNANTTSVIFNDKKRYNIVAYEYKTSHIMTVHYLLWINWIKIMFIMF